MKKTAVIPVIVLLVSACQLLEAAPSPTAEIQDVPLATESHRPCGDGVCDEAERADPDLCPRDCPGQGQNAVTAEVITAEPAVSTALPGAEMYEADNPDPLSHEVYLSQVNQEERQDSAWQHVQSLVGTMPSGQLYDMGAFCRVFSRSDDSGYDVIYGGSFRNREQESVQYVGNVHRVLGQDLVFETQPELFAERGGDFAIDTDGEYFYLLSGDGTNWRLIKYDRMFQRVGDVLIELPDKHANNDQMLRVANGFVFASGLYDPNMPEEGVEGPTQRDPGQAVYTHLWVYDLDLNYVRDVILDDHSNINGSTLVYYEGRYAVIAADNFFSNTLHALIYDEDWNFLEAVKLEDDAQWSMGSVYRDGKLYVAYHKGEHGSGDVHVGIYDTGWNLLETIEVTAVDKQVFNAQRPWIQVYDDRMFVSYDLGRDQEDLLDLQCVISVYEPAGY